MKIQPQDQLPADEDQQQTARCRPAGSGPAACLALFNVFTLARVGRQAGGLGEGLVRGGGVAEVGEDVGVGGAQSGGGDQPRVSEQRRDDLEGGAGRGTSQRAG